MQTLVIQFLTIQGQVCLMLLLRSKMLVKIQSDTVTVNYFIVDDINAPTAGSVVSKDFPLSPALAPGAQATLNLDAYWFRYTLPNISYKSITRYLRRIGLNSINP